MKTIFCVAEKPSVARNAAYILSNGKYQTEPTTDKYIKNFKFQTTFQNEQVVVIFTAVKGHLFTLTFPEEMQNWKTTDPYDLFSCELVTQLNSDMKHVNSNLKNCSKVASILMLWLDNDREGEEISEEVETVCKSVHKRLIIYRCRFSAISNSDILAAFNNPTTINRADCLAVKLRTEVDLRVGTAFTRFQSRYFRPILEKLLGEQLTGEKRIISYGTCQFPTLGFIVDAYNNHEQFDPENFWYIQCIIEKENQICELKWSRNHLFCKPSVCAIYSALLDHPIATVINSEKNQTHKAKPLPLTTVELQRKASKHLKIEPHVTMQIAERIYSSGYISYPRTETDSYPENFNFAETVEMLQKCEDDTISNYARNFEISEPRNGSHSDNAHPPIYPLKPPINLEGDELIVYNYIARHFLASISKNAIAEETELTFQIEDEIFHLKGLHIAERNYLQIYPYSTWNGKLIPSFSVGEKIRPSSLKVLEGKTTAPSLITESKLIKSMDRGGIGTDATIAEHIQKIRARAYTEKHKDLFYPTKLGFSLIKVYNKIGLDFDKPRLRAELEKSMQKISKNPELYQSEKERIIEEYKAAYRQVLENSKQLQDSFLAEMTSETQIIPSESTHIKSSPTKLTLPKSPKKPAQKKSPKAATPNKSSGALDARKPSSPSKLALNSRNSAKNDSKESPMKKSSKLRPDTKSRLIEKTPSSVKRQNSRK